MKRRKHFHEHLVINMRKAYELQRVGEERNILQTTKRRKANWFGHAFHRNRLLKQLLEEE
jgi:hypothetical protein